MSQFTIFCALSCHNFIWVSLREDSRAIKIVSPPGVKKQNNDAHKGGKHFHTPCFWPDTIFYVLLWIFIILEFILERLSDFLLKIAWIQGRRALVLFKKILRQLFKICFTNGPDPRFTVLKSPLIKPRNQAWYT